MVEVEGDTRTHTVYLWTTPLKKEKKDKNEYGKAVGKFLKKADFTGDAKKFDDVKGDYTRICVGAVGGWDDLREAAGVRHEPLTTDSVLATLSKPWLIVSGGR